MKRVGYRIRSCLVFLCLTLQLSTLFGDLNNGLVAWYPFDGNASDMSGNGNHGTVNGATLGTDRHGQANKAYSFDGVNDYIGINNYKGILNDNTRSVGCWINPSRISFQPIVTWGRPSTGKNWAFQMSDSGAIALGTFGSGGQISSLRLSTSNWMHVLVTFSGNNGNLNLFINSVLDNTMTSGLNLQTEGIFDVRVGRHNSGNGDPQFFKGSIDDVRIYNRALSAAEVSALYNLEKPKIPLTDSNFQTAVNLWFSDEANATATYGHISDWNVSAVTNMNNAFKNRTSFNEDIGGWDVGSVTTMSSIFEGARTFNQGIENWDTSNVTSMQKMFNGASSFEKDIGDWNTSAVISMRWMFGGTTSFDQDISDWDISAVTNTDSMFSGSSLSNANKGKIHENFASNPHWSNDWHQYVIIDNSNFQTAVDLWFDNQAEAISTYGHISDWNTSAVTDMESAFKDRTLSDFDKGLMHASFSSNPNWSYDWSDKLPIAITNANFHDAVDWWINNQTISTAAFGHISDWNVSAVTNMNNAFKNRTSFNEDIGGWDVGSVTTMSSIFEGARTFNQGIENWDTSNVTSMQKMFNGASSFEKDIGDWNTSAVISMRWMFGGTTSFDQDISDWDISAVTNTDSMFSGSSLSNANKGKIHENFASNPHWSNDWRQYVIIDNSNFQTAVDLWFDNQAEATATYGHISDWNVSAVTNMAYAFRSRSTFNEDIGGWDVSNVTSMNQMFRESRAFNQDISEWNTSSVTEMKIMFDGAHAFNQEIGSWDVSSVRRMEYMFRRAYAFNQDISGWNISSVTKMNSFFQSNTALSNAYKGKIHEAFSTNPNWSFDWREFVVIDDSNFHSAVNLWFDNQAEANATYGHIRDWNVSAVTNMAEAFMDRTTFNEDISNWDVSNVMTMVRIFYDASSFNQDISHWDISSVTTLNGAFRGADSFNQDIGDWNTSSVTDISYLFAGADSFNQNIGNWDVSNVKSMLGTFRFTDSFNQDLSTWDTSSVTRIAHAFELAQAFNQNLSDWNTSLVTDMTDVFKNTSALSGTNKGEIHKAFLSNPNWPYDWREYVLIDDSNFHSAVDLWFDNQEEANATYGHISDWNVSAVTSMYAAFKDRTLFNEDISSWDVSKVRNMERMFDHASSFDQNIGDWNVSSVTNMHDMFKGAQKFNHSLAQWDTSSVTRMSYMFADSNFNQPIGDWNTSSVITMTGMFRNTQKFNEDISSWDVSSVSKLNQIFMYAKAFDQNICDWNVSSVDSFEDAFLNTASLSVSNKWLIHESFSSNPNWFYDWSEFVSDTNQTDSPTDNNQTQPTSPDNNQTKTQPSFPDHNGTKPEVPGDQNVTQPPVVDGNQTIIPPTKDSNQTTIDAPAPELIVLAPMVTTYGHQRDENGTITLYGKIRSDGNGTIEQTGFYIRTSMDGNDTVLLTQNLSDGGSFSITVSSKDSFYFQAFAENEKGETRGTWKRVGATSQSYPIDGVVKTGDGWSTSEWFGDFRYFENGWAYHYGLGWVYLSSDGADGIWLWRKEHGWLWSNQATWPFLWNHTRGDWIYLLIREQQDPVFFDYSTGQYRR